MENRDFRAYVYVRAQLGNTATEIVADLTKVFPGSSPSFTTIFRWVSDIGKGQFSLEKDAPPGRPRTVATPEKVREVRSLVEANPVCHVQRLERKWGYLVQLLT